MTQKPDSCRLMIYSHDSFGLGHLRRCRAIAHALVDAYKGLSVLILTGSPIIGQFDFKARVDFVRIPGIIKLHNGSYTSLALHIDLEDTLALRESIIHHTARVFAPDIFLVDKEPTGLQGEVLSTLKMLKTTDTLAILGLRDVMDDPQLLEKEWERKDAWPALESLYDELWIYGPEIMGNPLEGISRTALVQHKMHFTGFLQRFLPENIDESSIDIPEQPYVLVTSGGGGDGIDMVDWVLRAYENSHLPEPALIVLGPFMGATERYEFMQRAEKLEQVSMITFSPNLEYLLFNAKAIVAMGGYNTFCEILSFDKPALIIPRSKPRKEQLIRATKAKALNLVSMIDPAEGRETDKMISALRVLSKQPSPSLATYEEYISGLDKITQRFSQLTGLNMPDSHKKASLPNMDVSDSHSQSKPPKVLFYVQYLLGIGHVRRAALVARNMTEQGFDVHVIFGGIPVPEIDFAPASVHYLMPLKSADANFSTLADEHGQIVSDAYKEKRCQQLLGIAADLQPDIVLTETYPFGRRQMRFELIPLLDWTQAQSPRPLVISSIRDILQRRKEKREQESIDLSETYYDKVLVHGDAAFTPLIDSFPPAEKILSKIGYSGYVCPPPPALSNERSGIVASVGGGSIGYELLEAALALYRSGYAADEQWCFMTGPNMPSELAEYLHSCADSRLTVLRMATDFVERLAKAKLSISLGGYNTTMDIIQTGVPSVMMPFEGEEETEQLERAQMLSDAGRIHLVRQCDLNPETLKNAMESALHNETAMPVIDTEGAANSPKLIREWWTKHHG
ncbi:MAG: Mlr3248 protein [uncultured Thiotrichaceae bacterium]|uniref:Mlr3248 protein n=1 Tax=uncultured Thiotrichaceae bacterium TaxID=298394 RepID=A0A6S6ST13_9GAMM|nr:MAG: Mlr3248 protein [uncultured Thiotrichaceae bacterium]